MIKKLIPGLVVPVVLFAMVCGSSALAASGMSVANPEAVAEVMAGLRDEALVTWWGFDPHDSTEYLQAAIDSGVSRLIVPDMGQDWVVRPIFLRSDMEIIFEDGVVVSAKKGDFLGRHDCLFRIVDVENVIVRGYGATFRMHKEDYTSPPYTPGEWRMGIRIAGSKNVQVLGVTIENTGGDGIYIGRGERGYSEDIVIRDVVSDNNHRQGMSVISVKNLLIENSVFKNTQGTPPMAGIDFEPNREDEILENIVVRNTVFEGNRSSGIVLSLNNLNNETRISFLFENILIRGNGSGFYVKARPRTHPTGEIVVRNCIMEDIRRNAIRIEHVDQETMSIVFDGCILHNVTTEANLLTSHPGTAVPVFMEGPTRIGDVYYKDFIIADTYDRPVIYLPVGSASTPEAFAGVRGRIEVINPHGAQVLWGRNTPTKAAMDGIQLEVVNRESAVVDYGRVISLPGYEQAPLELVMPPTINFRDLAGIPPHTTVRGTYSPDIRLLYFDDNDVNNVEVLLNDEPIYAGKQLLPNSIVIDTTQLADERHQFTVRVDSKSLGSLENSAYFNTNNFEHLIDQLEGPRDLAWFGTVYNPRSSDQSDGWRYVTDEPDHFFGDTTRKTRVTPTQQFIVWDAPGLREFNVTLFAKDRSFEQFLVLEESGDGEAWQPLAYTSASEGVSPAGWQQFVLSGYPSSEQEVNHFRLTLKETSTTDDIQLGHVHFVLLKR